MPKIPLSYYQQTDVLFLAKNLLGKLLVTQVEGKLCGAMITETEAYRGRDDKASHAYNGRRTARTEIMYALGGKSYVYLCYGIHRLFNIVTNAEDVADAVLVRAVQPVFGVEEMLKRRKQNALTKAVSSGPGTLTQALGIGKTHNHLSLTGNHIWLEEFQSFAEKDIVASPRIGIDYAEEDAALPWRFYPKNNPYISKK